MLNKNWGKKTDVGIECPKVIFFDILTLVFFNIFLGNLCWRFN